MEAAAAVGTMVVEATTTDLEALATDLEAGLTAQQDLIHTPEQNHQQIPHRALLPVRPTTSGPLQAPQATTIRILTHRQALATATTTRHPIRPPIRRPTVEAPAVRLRILTVATTTILRYTTYTHLRAHLRRLITATRTTMTTGVVAHPATIRVIRPTTVMLTITTLLKRRSIRRPTKCDWMQRQTS